jgi:hypothetical protein
MNHRQDGRWTAGAAMLDELVRATEALRPLRAA